MKFDDMKSIPAWDLLKQLQDKTRLNGELIKENSALIQSVLRGKIKMESGRFDVAAVQAKNNELLQENSQYLRLHNMLLTYLKSLINDEGQNEVLLPVVETSKAVKVNLNNEVSFEETFEKTTKGILDFNSRHPFYDNDNFRKKLLDYYTQKEEYEKCAVLVNSNSR